MITTGCMPKVVVVAPADTNGLLSRFREDLAKGSFESVIHQSQRVLKGGESKPPADIALYALGETYAHHAFPGRDHSLSRQYFAKLIANFPDSPLAWEAKTYVILYETCGALNTTPDYSAEQLVSATVAHESREKINFEEALRKINESCAERCQNMATPANQRSGVGLARGVRESQHFAEAVRSNQTLLEQSGRHAPADAALYNLGLIYAHIDNPAKDFHKSRGYFAELSRDFPNSPLAEEARVWVGLFQIIEKMQQIDLDIEQQKKQLKQ